MSIIEELATRKFSADALTIINNALAEDRELRFKQLMNFAHLKDAPMNLSKKKAGELLGVSFYTINLLINTKKIKTVVKEINGREVEFITKPSLLEYAYEKGVI